MIKKQFARKPEVKFMAAIILLPWSQTWTRARINAYTAAAIYAAAAVYAAAAAAADTTAIFTLCVLERTIEGCVAEKFDHDS